jgi:long-chain acyl-CoA synthetase
VCRLTRDSKKIEQVTQQFTQVQCTSQAIPADLRSRFLEKFSLALQDCYGMTELGGPLSLQTHADALAKNDQSTPIAGIEVSIQDDGALWIASSYRMMGYLKSGKLVSPFDEKGFLDTGDLATMNGPCIEITGRVKDLIIRGGINTSPARIESVMSECEAIEEVAVLGMPHSFWGEEIVAVVVGANFDEGVIMAFCRRRLDTHEVPDRVIQMQELPRSFIGKVLKKNLAEQLKR